MGRDMAGASTSGGKTLLFYVHALAGGGAERVVAILASGFARVGWRVILAVDHPDEANRAFLDPRVEVIVLGGHHSRSIVRLARLLRRAKPDVSFSAMAASNLKHMAAAVLAGRANRTVLSYHAFAGSEPQLLSQAGYRLLPVLSRLASRTVAVSKALRDDLVAHWKASGPRTVTVYNPVVFGPGGAAEADAAPATPLLLTAGRLIPDKNMRGVVRAFAKIAPRCNARLVILGDGPDRAALAADIASLGLDTRVELKGYVAEPWALYRRANCFVTASRLESFSMVIVEALAHGLPVVAVDSPGPREILDDGRFGALVPADDDDALAEAMLRALTEPVDPDVQRARGRMFSVEAGLEAYRRLFSEVAAEAAHTRGSRRRSWVTLFRPDPS